MQGGGGLDPRIPKYITLGPWGLWWMVSEIWSPLFWTRLGLALEEWETYIQKDRQTDKHCEILSPLALRAGGENKIDKFVMR